MNKYENQEFYYNCDGIDLHMKIDFPEVKAEKMPVLILIHGFTGHMEERHIVAAAKTATDAGYVVIRPEMYGHGKSGGEWGDHNVMIWVHEAVRIIRYALSLPYTRDVCLAGHSQGGLTAVLAAGIMCDVVKALIPLAPAMCIPDDARRGEMLGHSFDPCHLPEDVGFPGKALSSDYVRIARMLPVNDAIVKYKKPVLIIHGTDDETVAYDYSVRLASGFANAKLVPIEGDSHCFDHHLDKLTEALGEFLRTLCSN